MSRRFNPDELEAIDALNWLREGLERPAAPLSGAEQHNPWNIYIHVVGTDRQGGSNFNVMREALQQRIAHAYPRFDIVIDYHGGQWQTRRFVNAQATPIVQTGAQSLDFQRVYRVIQALASQGAMVRIRQLHFLTHSTPDCIYYAPVAGACSSAISTSLGGTATRSGIRSAFANAEVIKLHGCSYVQAIRDKIREYNRTRNGRILSWVKNYISNTYAFQLASYIGQPVWAAPLGAGANYRCSQLSNIFCVDTSTYRVDLQFYNTNYHHFFARAANERIFDATHHMQYKPTLA